MARAGNDLDRRLGRDSTEDVTLDLDATETKVFGRKKRGAGRSRHGHLAYNSYAVTWAQRGRALTSELKGGNQARIKAAEAGRMLGRAERLLPAEHGQITVRGDTGFYSVELMTDCRKRGMRFTFSATRTQAMWAKLPDIDEGGWTDAIDMDGAQVAELSFTPKDWKHEPLRLHQWSSNPVRDGPSGARTIGGPPGCSYSRKAALTRWPGDTPAYSPKRQAVWSWLSRQARRATPGSSSAQARR